MALNPSFENLLLACEVEISAGLYGEAVSRCRQAADKNTDAWLPRLYLGTAYMNNDQFEEAVAPLKKALELAKDQERSTRINIHTRLGFVYEKQGKYPEAIDAYQKAGMAEAVARVGQEAGRSEEQEKLRREEQAKDLEKMLKNLGSPPPKPPLGR